MIESVRMMDHQRNRIVLISSKHEFNDEEEEVDVG